MEEGTKQGPNLQDLTPDELRWGWCDKNRNNGHIKCYALGSSQNHPPPLSTKTLAPGAKKVGGHWSQGRTFKCPQLFQAASLGRCWSRGVPRDRTSPAWGPQQTSDSLGGEGRDLFHFFLISLWGKLLKLSNSLTVYLIKCFLSFLICEVPTVTITVLIYLIVLLTLWI